MQVTPWEVADDIDYTRLVKEFGLEVIKELPKEFSQFLLFRRRIIFAGRDFSQIVTAVQKGNPFAMMTGLMPSGKFHFGHKAVADQIKAYQKLGAKVFVAVADIEAHTVRGSDYKELRKLAIQEYLTNYAALGIDINAIDFYFQSARSPNARKSNAYYRLAADFSAKATMNEFKGVYGVISPAKLFSSTLQASDMYHPQLKEFCGKMPVVIPVGVDQDPHVRLARGMGAKVEHDFFPLSATYNLFLPGLKGGKMSSSDETTYIALTDTPEIAKKKINKYALSGGGATLEEHRTHGGNPDIDIPFQLLRFGLEEDDEKLAQLEAQYRSGELLTGELKKHTIEKLSIFLEAHAKKREAVRPAVEAVIANLGI